MSGNPTTRPIACYFRAARSTLKMWLVRPMRVTARFRQLAWVVLVFG
jgi:hypothetical protein